MYVTWNSTISELPSQHWGIFPETPATTTTLMSKMPEDTAKSSSLQSHWKKLGMTNHVTPTPTLVCHNEFSCRMWCDKEVHRSFKRMLRLLIGGTAVTALATLGIVLTIFGRRISQRWQAARAELRRSMHKDAQAMELVQMDAEGMTTAEPEQTVGKRIRGKVRFEGTGNDGTVDSTDIIREMSDDGGCGPSTT
jgi:hypothetical protein